MYKTDKQLTLSKGTVLTAYADFYKTEFVLALIIAVLASLASFSTLLFCSNDTYPLTADSMGHLTKVRYLAQCFNRFELPSWFPQWYNGSTVMQYYPPLSYVLMAPIEMICQNVTITFKVFCFSVLFIGGMGVWLFCRNYIGAWCGLFGIVTYCTQTFLTRSLYGAGVLAQGPVFAISPWYILVALSYAYKPKRYKFFFISFLTFLLILSHAMHAFMVCLCIALVLFVFVLIKKIKFINFFTLGVSIVIGAVLAGYWWIIGSTSFETPGIPYLLEEAGLLYTATWEWFIPGEGNKAGLVFGISVTIATILALCTYIVSNRIKINNENDKYYTLFNIILTIFTFIFSFGQRIPIFKLVPLYKSLVPGRILSLSAVSGAICCAYLVYSIIRFSVGKKSVYRTLSNIICIGVITAVIVQLNPYKDTHETMDINSDYEKVMPLNSGSGSFFDKGRYEWIAPVHSSETYFPIQYGFNTADGWNIEGTPHNRSIWRYNIALMSDCEDYIIKDLLFWNVRSVLTLASRNRFRSALERSIYHLTYEKSINEWNSGVLYTSDVPSSYFIVDKRDCITIGMGSPPVSLEFPFMVKEYSDNIADYPIEELMKFKLIYLCEPPVETLEQAGQIEKIIRMLVQNGSTVIIEPSNIQNIPLFNVSPIDINFENNPVLTRVDGSLIKSSIDSIDFQESKTTRALAGLDEVYYKLYANNCRLQNDIIGAKNINEGKVYFIGMHLSQYLKSSRIFINGYNENETYPYSDKVKALITDILNMTPHNKSFAPEPFPVEYSAWNHKGGEFDYSIDKPQEMIVSVSYTPRWKVTVDGKPIQAKQRENLVMLELPAGKHKVNLHYSLTVYGIIGYCLTVFGVILLIVHTIFLTSLEGFYITMGKIISRYLEIGCFS